MDLETFIVAVFCAADDFMRTAAREHRLRRRGPAPVLADSEVLTIEAVGEFLGLDTDKGLHAYFRRHFGHLFPGLRVVHRTTFLRQAANLWTLKAALWQHLAAATGQDAALVLVDSLPVPVCRFARAHRCRSLAGLAAFGYDPLAHQTYYGLRLHLRITWPGVITAATLAPANAADRAVAPQLLEGLTGWALGDGAYWSRTLRAMRTTIASSPSWTGARSAPAACTRTTASGGSAPAPSVDAAASPKPSMRSRSVKIASCRMRISAAWPIASFGLIDPSVVTSRRSLS